MVVTREKQFYTMLEHNGNWESWLKRPSHKFVHSLNISQHFRLRRGTSKEDDLSAFFLWRAIFLTRGDT